MSSDPWDDRDPNRDPGRDRDPDSIDWGSSVVIAIGAVLLVGLVIVAGIFVGMNSGLLGADGPADSDGAPESGANTTEGETASNETTDSDDSAENDSSEAPSSDPNPGGSADDTGTQDGGSDDDESDTSSSSSVSDSDSDADSSDSDDTSDSDESQEQEQSNDQQDQEQSRDDSDSGEDESEDERPVYDLTVHTGNEKPVSGADVTIERHADGATTTRTTGSDGSVTFPVYPGDYTIRAEDPNGNVEETTVTVTSDTRVEMTSLLNERPETHTLTVTVVDQTGAPIAGVEVGGIGGVLPSGADAEVFGTTNAEGKAYLEVYEGHNYLIDVFHPDSQDVITKEIRIEGDESLRFELDRSGAAQQSSENNEAAA